MSEFQTRVINLVERLVQLGLFLGTGIAMLLLSKQQPELHAVGLGCLIAAATLAGISPQQLTGSPLKQLAETVKSAAPALVVGLGVALLVGLADPGCATLKTAAKDCAPVSLGDLETAADSLATQLSALPPIPASSYELQAAVLAGKYGLCVLVETAKHLLGGESIAGVVTALHPRHYFPSFHRAFLEYIAYRRGG